MSEFIKEWRRTGIFHVLFGLLLIHEAMFFGVALSNQDGDWLLVYYPVCALFLGIAEITGNSDYFWLPYFLFSPVGFVLFVWGCFLKWISDQDPKIASQKITEHVPKTAHRSSIHRLPPP